MLTVVKLFMFGPFAALFAVLCRAEMMGLIRSAGVDEVTVGWGEVHLIQKYRTTPEHIKVLNKIELKIVTCIFLSMN